MPLAFMKLKNEVKIERSQSKYVPPKSSFGMQPNMGNILSELGNKKLKKVAPVENTPKVEEETPQNDFRSILKKREN